MRFFARFRPTVERKDFVPKGKTFAVTDRGLRRRLDELDGHLRSIYRDGFLCTAYEPSTGGQPKGLEKNAFAQAMWGDQLLEPIAIQYEGTEGELYDMEADPHQWHNLWDDRAHRSLRDDLVADFYDSLPTKVNRREVESVA